MNSRLYSFANILVAALVVGAMFGICLHGNPTELTADAYVQQQQSSIRALNVAMPALGVLAGALTLIAALFSPSGTRRCVVLVTATFAFLVAGLVTRFGNQPINAVMMVWSPTAPPNNWTVLRDEWWQWHVVRTAAGLVGLALLIVAGLDGGRPSIELASDSSAE